MSHAHNRATNRVDATGTKKYDFIAFGKVSGTWDASFNLDYDYLEFLAFVFDTMNGATWTSEETKCVVDRTDVVETVLETGEGVAKGDKEYEFKLSKSDYGRVPSFVCRTVQLNRIAGGGPDEITEIRGCVCTGIRFSQSAGSSQWNVSMSGFCTRQVTWLGKLTATDYKSYNGNLMQFACLFKDNGDYGISANPQVLKPSKTNWVANCETIQVTIQNNADRVDSTCTPYSPGYFEQKTNYEFSTSVYSTDPFLFKQRVYTGGRALKNDDPGVDDVYGCTGGGKYLTTDLCKNLAPMNTMAVYTYDACCNDNSIQSGDDVDRLSEAIKISKRRMNFDLFGLLIKSISYQRGDGSKIMDQVSSVECKEITMTLVLPRKTLFNPENKASIQGFMYDNATYKWDTNGKWKDGKWVADTDPDATP